MNPLVENGIVGILTGIATTWLILLGRLVWTHKVTPYLRATRYQGVRVDGQWVGASEDEDHKSEARLFLTQSAHELGGSFTFSFKNHAKDFTLGFIVQGYMWEGYVTLNFIPQDKRLTSYATGLFKHHAGGHVLAGQFCFRDVEAETVKTVPMTIVWSAADGR
jgi:hypothetical protein